MQIAGRSMSAFQIKFSECELEQGHLRSLRYNINRDTGENPKHCGVKIHREKNRKVK